jgi:predicted outer membrane repeat protein
VPLSVTSSTFSSNRAAQNGGAIVNDGVATITNSTFSGNTAANFGGIRNGGTLDLSSSTLTLNTATNQGGGIFNTNVATVRNTIVAENTAPLNPDVDGPFTSEGYNLIGDGTGAVGFTNGVNGDLVGTAGSPINPNLGALANNGGPTQTHALNVGSPAIGTGNSAIAPATDQRGLTRPSGSAVDIGAFEVQQIVITAPDNSASENPIDTGTFRVSRSGTVGNLTVNLAIDGSSTAVAADYNLGSTFPVTIPDGQSFVDVILTPVDDAIPELAETLQLNLANGNYAIAQASSNAAVTIAANDSIAYAIALTNPATGSLIEGNSGTKPVTFTVTRSGGTGVASTVNYAIAGSAIDGADYNIINAAGATTAMGTIAFAANETTKTIAVDVLGDTAVEPDETITVTLSNPNLTAAPESSTITTNTATATIANDDSPSISIDDVVVTEGNTGTASANFTVSLSAASSLPVTVNYATSDGTANTADSDYAAATGSLTFNAGDTTKTITVAVNGDSKFETDETFNVNLSTAVNATITKATGIGAIANDDLESPTPTPTPTPTPALHSCGMLNANSQRKFSYDLS